MCQEEFLGVAVRIPVHDYKSLPAAVMIWTTLVNTQTHTERDSFRQLTPQPS